MSKKKEYKNIMEINIERVTNNPAAAKFWELDRTEQIIINPDMSSKEISDKNAEHFLNKTKTAYYDCPEVPFIIPRIGESIWIIAGLHFHLLVTNVTYIYRGLNIIIRVDTKEILP